jgi:hypothetical protein
MQIITLSYKIAFLVCIFVLFSFSGCKGGVSQGANSCEGAALQALKTIKAKSSRQYLIHNQYQDDVKTNNGITLNRACEMGISDSNSPQILLAVIHVDCDVYTYQSLPLGGVSIDDGTFANRRVYKNYLVGSPNPKDRLYPQMVKSFELTEVDDCRVKQVIRM